MHAEENQPDIILLDIKMKGKMDGMYTAASFQHKNIPVIFLIANADDAISCVEISTIAPMKNNIITEV